MSIVVVTVAEQVMVGGWNGCWPGGMSGGSQLNF